MGAKYIVSKISSLPIKEHQVNNYDTQPSEAEILIYLSGLIYFKGETNGVNFVRVFLSANSVKITNFINLSVKNDIYKISFA
jgi:hypothetical protein